MFFNELVIRFILHININFKEICKLYGELIKSQEKDYSTFIHVFQKKKKGMLYAMISSTLLINVLW